MGYEPATYVEDHLAENIEVKARGRIGGVNEELRSSRCCSAGTSCDACISHHIIDVMGEKLFSHLRLDVVVAEHPVILDLLLPRFWRPIHPVVWRQKDIWHYRIAGGILYLWFYTLPFQKVSVLSIIFYLRRAQYSYFDRQQRCRDLPCLPTCRPPPSRRWRNAALLPR